jgi:hypothetical protein
MIHVDVEIDTALVVEGITPIRVGSGDAAVLFLILDESVEM